MVRELPVSGIEAYAKDFPGTHLDMVIASVLAGNTRAHFYTCGNALLLWDQGNNVFYLSGIVDSSIVALAAWIGQTLRQLCQQEKGPYFGVHPLSVGWVEHLPALFAGVELSQRGKYFYRHSGSPLAGSSLANEPQVQFTPIDAALLARDDLKNLEDLRGEVDWMWSSRQQFEQRGFGVAAVVEDTVVCRCTAEYLSAGMCGIGIETLESYQQRGIATATAARFVNMALERHVAPFWECQSRNTPSVRLAEKLGFERIEESTAWVGKFIPG